MLGQPCTIFVMRDHRSFHLVVRGTVQRAASRRGEGGRRGCPSLGAASSESDGVAYWDRHALGGTGVLPTDGRYYRFHVD
jgi:hypothetical protein